MKYTTTNEFENFGFDETYMKDLELGDDYVRIWLDNVKIKPENSKNRDIRVMRANSLLVTIQNMKIKAFIREGIKVYNANGVPVGNRPDESIKEAEYGEILPLFLEGAVAEFTKEICEEVGKSQENVGESKKGLVENCKDARTGQEGTGNSKEKPREYQREAMIYTLAVDASDGETYSVVFAGKCDIEEWDRFLNLDSM